MSAKNNATNFKNCPKCHQNRKLTEFNFKNKELQQYQPKCRSCESRDKRLYFNKNSKKILIRNKEWRVKNPQKIKIDQKQYYNKNQKELLLQKKRYYVENCTAIIDKRFCYYNKNSKNIIKQNTEYKLKRLQSSPQFKLVHSLRTRLRHALKNNQKTGSAVGDLGCSINSLKSYLEAQFKSGMSWDNHGEWHIDHIRPLSSFDLTNRKELLKACHYTNLQPLWKGENLEKGSS